ncbi:hypothetical protein M758_6G077100 [Ceratodon purpureus]|uniref:Uncharacterized protein n=1 Tax=Ceratodon purpureus TaxID=3225 RepID=A0A8T0HCT0_CERPU|nr:hypothetical protein KC19_6G081600 [Ceratodon purpureus]KAG0613102.1 hypothetical protein M758_6G077100 [Ceratodon purpureus]
MGPKKGGKKKLPAYWSEPVDCEPFGGLKARDLIRTPLGLFGTVLGVKYETKERGEPGTGTMWVQYANGFLSPIVADFSTSGYAGFEGYQRLSDGDHMWRDVKEFHQAREEGENVREIIDADNEKYVAELIADWEKKNKGNKKGGKKGGKKKK